MTDIELIAKAIKQEIQKEIIRIQLIDTGDFLASVGYKIRGNTIIFFSDSPYSEAIEFGTLDFGRFTRENFPKSASDALGFKKKDMDTLTASKLPVGQVSFSPFRRVLYNKVLIERIIQKFS